MAINKVVYGNTTLIDLTADTATVDKVLKDQTFHGADGEAKTGTCTFDSDTTDATVQVAEMLVGKTAYARGAKLTGTMPNNGGIEETIDDINDEVAIPQGYHDGSGSVAIDATEKAKLIANNIREGVTVLGVTGTLEPSSEVTAQSKEITPSASWNADQTVLPDAGYDYLSQVKVKKIPYVETPNSAGGNTVTIG